MADGEKMANLNDKVIQINMEDVVMFNHISDRARTLEASQIREIAEHGMKLSGFGETALGQCLSHPIFTNCLALNHQA